jgi:hypothetical protein
MIPRARPAAIAVLLTLALTVGLVPGLPGAAVAQVAVFPTSEPARWARVEAGRPDVNGSSQVGTLSSVWFFTLSRPIPGGVVMVAEIPMAYATVEGRGNRTVAAFGNPYVGARLQFDTGPLTEFEIGIRLPLAGEQNEAMGLGMWSDLADRPEAFYYRAMPLTLRAVRSTELGPTTAIDLAGGAIYWLMSGPEHTEQAIFATYSGQARAGLGPLQLAAGASGRYAVLGHPIQALAGATHQASASVDLGRGSIRPGFYVTLPLTEPATSEVGATLGLRLLVPL